MRIAVLPVVWIVGLSVVLWTARWPSSRFDSLPTPHQYPTSAVAWTALLMTVQIVVQLLVLRPRTYSRSWARAFAAAAVAIPFVLLAGLLAMHAPPYWCFYAWWVIVVALGLLLLAAWSAFARIRHRHVT